MTNNKPILSIVTPNLNGGEYLEETILSVINQDYENIEYIIIDGGSDDQSHEIIKKYMNKIDYFEIKKDRNMYEAIHYGFAKSKGEILAWINSDDLYYPNCISKIVNKINTRKYRWINCISSSLKNKKKFSYKIPFYFPTEYILQGKCHKSEYGFIPQESVFFSREIYLKAGGVPTKYNQSGDYYLWKELAKYSELMPVNLHAGIFRKRKNQLTENPNIYYSEIKKNYKKSYNLYRYFISILYFLFKFYKL